MTGQDRALVAAYAAHLGVRDEVGRLEAFGVLGLSVTRAFQRLNHLLDDPDAWAHDPATMGLLLRRREARARRVA